MMRDHGMIGRHYAGAVTQIISGSIGFDDWEWGVDLFADDPAGLQEADLRDALRRGQRLVRGVRAVLRRPAVLAAELPQFLDGEVPRSMPATVQARRGYTGQEALMSPVLKAHFTDYASFHGTPGNKACHYVGIPLIVLSLFALLRTRPALRGGRLHGDAGRGAARWSRPLYYLTAGRGAGRAHDAAVGRRSSLVGRPPCPVGVGAWRCSWWAGSSSSSGTTSTRRRSPAFYRNLAHLLVRPALDPRQGRAAAPSEPPGGRLSRWPAALRLLAGCAARRRHRARSPPLAGVGCAAARRSRARPPSRPTLRGAAACSSPLDLQCRAGRPRAPVRGRAGRPHPHRPRRRRWWRRRSSTSRAPRRLRRRARPARPRLPSAVRRERPLLRQLHGPQRRHAHLRVPRHRRTADTADPGQRAPAALRPPAVRRTTTAAASPSAATACSTSAWATAARGGDPLGNGQDLRHATWARCCASTSTAARPYARARATTRSSARAGALPRDLGLRPAQSLALRLRPRRPATSTSATSARTRCEEIDVGLAAAPRRRELRLEHHGGHALLPPGQRLHHAGLTLPVLEYPHGEGCSVTGGVVYRGCRMPGYAGTTSTPTTASRFVRSFRLQGGQAVRPARLDGAARAAGSTASPRSARTPRARSTSSTRTARSTGSIRRLADVTPRPSPRSRSRGGS